MKNFQDAPNTIFKYKNPSTDTNLIFTNIIVTKINLQPAHIRVYINTAATCYFHSHQSCQTGNTWRNQRWKKVVVAAAPPVLIFHNCDNFWFLLAVF